MSLSSRLLYLPRAPNPTGTTWAWIGVGTLAAIGLGAAYYRHKRCAVTSTSAAQQYVTPDTTDPRALSAAALASMSPGDSVGIPVGVSGPAGFLSQYPIQIVPGTLYVRENGFGMYKKDCFFPAIKSKWIRHGPTEPGYAQFAGALFPPSEIGTTVPFEHVPDYSVV